MKNEYEKSLGIVSESPYFKLALVHSLAVHHQMHNIHPTTNVLSKMTNTAWPCCFCKRCRLLFISHLEKNDTDSKQEICVCCWIQRIAVVENIPYSQMIGMSISN